MYTITNSKDEIGLDAVINSDMIIGVIDKNNNRTCIMKTHNHNDLYKRFELSRYVVLPFITGKKIYNENMNDDYDNICGIEETDINKLVSVGGEDGKLKPVKAFNNWKEAYEWMLGNEE